MGEDKYRKHLMKNCLELNSKCRVSHVQSNDLNPAVHLYWFYWCHLVLTSAFTSEV